MPDHWMSNRRPTETGIYLYKIPGIDGKGDFKGELLVEFTLGCFPERMCNIPVAALWEKIY